MKVQGQERACVSRTESIPCDWNMKVEWEECDLTSHNKSFPHHFKECEPYFGSKKYMLKTFNLA